jgi:hypothetical protein
MFKEHYLKVSRWLAPGFVNYKKGYTRLATASDKGYQLLAHGRWLSPGTPASSTNKSMVNNATEGRGGRDRMVSGFATAYQNNQCLSPITL